MSEEQSNLEEQEEQNLTPDSEPTDSSDEAHDSEDQSGALPNVELSTEEIFSRFGVEEEEEEEVPFLFEEPAEPEPEEEPEVTEEEPEELTEEELLGVLPDPFEQEVEEPSGEERGWYVLHCYSGYEHKVKHNLELRIESMGMQDYIYQVVIPTIEEIEIKGGKRRNVERCLYPGYIMVQMNMTDDSWYVVRNTPGVTGFVGGGNRPTPLRSDAVQGILRKMEAAAPQVRATFKLGQKVRITEGPFADFIGVVDDIDEARAKVRVLVSFFGRETPVELDFLQVEDA